MKMIIETRAANQFEGLYRRVVNKGRRDVTSESPVTAKVK